MKSVLFSDKNFGGAEIYVRILKDRFGIDFSSLRGITWHKLLELYLSKNDLVLHDVRAGLLGLIRLKKNDIVVIHGPGRSNLVMALFIFLAYLKNLKIVFVSSELQNQFYFRRESWHTVSNISSIKTTLTENSNDFLYIGRITESKGVVDLVNFWNKKMKNQFLHIVGDGNLLKDLRRKANNNIIFHGKKDHEYIADLINDRIKFYISLSRREGLSLSLLEAISAGLVPIVINMPSQIFIEKEIGSILVNQDLSNLNQVIDYSIKEQNEISTAALNWFVNYEKKSLFNTFWKKELEHRKCYDKA